MTEQEISNALRERLARMWFLSDGQWNVSGGWLDLVDWPDGVEPPIVWENAPGVWSGTGWETPAPPFWVVSQVKTPTARPGIENWHMFAGRLVVAVMVGDATFTSVAETHAEAIVARFAADTLLTAGDGQITIRERPYADDGYNDGAYWRVNVHVRWQAME